MRIWDRQNRKGTALLFLSILLIIIGVLRQEPVTVLEKAIRICMECIGIG